MLKHHSMHNYSQLQSIILKKQTIDIIGEIVYDAYEDNRMQIAGAPLNVLLTLKSFNTEATIYSSIGQDSLGDDTMRILSKHVNCKHITAKALHTDIVDIYSKNGNTCFTIQPKSAFDSIEFNPKNAFVYYGSLAMRYTRNRDRLLVSRNNDNIYICDLNIRVPHCSKESITRMLEIADILKVNSTELEYIYETYNCNKSLKILSELFNISVILCTLGENGCTVFCDNVEKHYNAEAITVVNDVGAGDCFTAGFMYGILLNYGLEEAVTFAMSSAYKVCKRKESHLYEAL